MAKKRLDVEEFLKAYLQAHEQGLTRDEFAKKIGVKPESVYQRVNELRRKLKDRGLEVPVLEKARRKSFLDRAEALLATVSRPPVPDQTEPAEDPLAELLG